MKGYKASELVCSLSVNISWGNDWKVSAQPKHLPRALWETFRLLCVWKGMKMGAKGPMKGLGPGVNSLSLPCRANSTLGLCEGPAPVVFPR